jgi:nicotinamide mononucleotide transporter
VLWIAVDLIAVPLYYSRGLQLSAGLYLVFLALAVGGLVAWRRALKQAKQQSPEGGTRRQ